MAHIVRKYGDQVEITEIEKEPSKIRVYRPRERRTLFGLRRPDNIYRTKQICLRRVLSAIKAFGRPLLVTLTFAGDASDASFANDSLRVFQVRLRAKFPQAQSLFIPELSKRGRIHFHGLLFNVPLHLGDTRIGIRRLPDGDERKTRTLAKLWGEGFVDALQTDGSPALAAYISKYITKGAGQIMFNAMRILRVSHGFPKEVIERGELAKETVRRYANEKPFRTWIGEMDFIGIITKDWYKEI